MLELRTLCKTMSVFRSFLELMKSPNICWNFTVFFRCANTRCTISAIARYHWYAIRRFRNFTEEIQWTVYNDTYGGMRLPRKYHAVLPEVNNGHEVLAIVAGTKVGWKCSRSCDNTHNHHREQEDKRADHHNRQKEHTGEGGKVDRWKAFTNGYIAVGYVPIRLLLASEMQFRCQDAADLIQFKMWAQAMRIKMDDCQRDMWRRRSKWTQVGASGQVTYFPTWSIRKTKKKYNFCLLIWISMWQGVGADRHSMSCNVKNITVLW